MLQSPYSQQPLARQRPATGGGGGGGGDGLAGAGFRSDALQLEVKLAEGLQALQMNGQGGGGGGGGDRRRHTQERLQLFRTLWEKVIERGGPRTPARPSHPPRPPDPSLPPAPPSRPLLPPPLPLPDPYRDPNQTSRSPCCCDASRPSTRRLCCRSAPAPLHPPLHPPSFLPLCSRAAPSLCSPAPAPHPRLPARTPRAPRRRPQHLHHLHTPRQNPGAGAAAENATLRAELRASSAREARLKQQLDAYEARLQQQEEHMEQMQMGLAQQQQQHDQQAFEDEEAAAAEVAAELAQEMPASARPGCITPTLGSGRLGTIPKPPAQPSCILSLDMGAVAAAREVRSHGSL